MIPVKRPKAVVMTIVRARAEPERILAGVVLEPLAGRRPFGQEIPRWQEHGVQPKHRDDKAEDDQRREHRVDSPREDDNLAGHQRQAQRHPLLVGVCPMYLDCMARAYRLILRAQRRLWPGTQAFVRCS